MFAQRLFTNISEKFLYSIELPAFRVLFLSASWGAPGVDSGDHLECLETLLKAGSLLVAVIWGQGLSQQE